MKPLINLPLDYESLAHPIYDNFDKELKSIIIQIFLSINVRRYALLETDLTLDKLLAKGRVFEVSDIQATESKKPFNPHRSRRSP